MLAAMLLFSAVPAVAGSGEDHLATDAPESWAMFFYTSVTSFSGQGAPHTREPWSIDLSLDLGSVPQLNEDQRRVGFSGTRVEDLNKTAIFGRPAVTVGLPWRMALSLGYIPPIKIFGVRTNLFSAAIERPLVERGPWTLGTRLHGEYGHARGAFTCDGNALQSPPGSDGNPDGCETKSNDTAIQRYVGLELAGSYRIDALHGLAPYLTMGANYLNTEFHVHARTFDFDDRTKLESDTWAFSLGAGATFPLDDRIRLALGVFYVPLWVTRPPDTSEDRSSLVQARAEITYQLR